MARKGWISIRNAPKCPASHNDLVKFFSRHGICPSCDGRGFTVKKDGDIDDGVTNIKTDGIPDLMILAGNKKINLPEVLRELMQILYWGRKACKKCHGSRFIKLEDA